MEASATPATTHRRRIGGSDIAKLLGLSKYGNARDVYDRVVLGLEEPAGPLADRGKRFEPVCRAHAQNHLGVSLDEHTGWGDNRDYYDHAHHEFARAQIDDLAHWFGIPVVCDYKTVNKFSRRYGWGKPGTDIVPEAYRAQVAWGMACADRDRAIVVAAFGEDVKDERVFIIEDICTYEIERCPEFESYLLGVANEFWLEHVIPERAPEIKPIGKNKVKTK
jgi:predicted phage-related endonuclease